MTGIRNNDTAVREARGEQKRRRDLFFPLPSRIILNEQGVSFFMAHHRPLHCFESADGERQFGFRLETAGYSWLKKLIMNNYLKKVEIQVRDISVCRGHLEDVVKLVFFSMFRRRINASIPGHVYDSPMIRAWNRANPKKSIGPGMKIRERPFRDILNAKSPGRLEELKNELYRGIIKNLSSLPAEPRDDYRERCNFTADVISNMSPLVFFVLAGSREDDKRILVQNISRGILEFIHRLDMVNLAALLAIELVSAAERSALVRMLEYAGNITGILEDPEKRKSIMKEKRFRGSTVVAAVPEDIPQADRRIRFRISVYNDGADAEEERRLMEDFTVRNFTFKDGRDLEEFFRAPRSKRENSVYEDNGLCFYHLNTLRDQCRKNNILLDAAIKNSSSGKSVVTSLWFGF
ncbi:MAG: hypothetical protein LBG10_00880 [Treponema sp.]|jgi:hypothetical protein|nr:hypothetical protein [Treponema sp.]